MISALDRAGFRSHIAKERRFKIDNLFEFRRGRGDLILSLVMLAFVVFLFWNFGEESAWNDRDLSQKRVGKILKQPWIGPFLCMALLLPAAIFNVYQSYRQRQKDTRLHIPQRDLYEIGQWARAIEYVAYFIIYTFCVPVLGYLVSTILFTIFLTYRLGYRSRFWITISFLSSFAIVLVFRTFLQIKTPVNIWLYDQLPPLLGTFMKIYF